MRQRVFWLVHTGVEVEVDTVALDIWGLIPKPTDERQCSQVVCIHTAEPAARERVKGTVKHLQHCRASDDSDSNVRRIFLCSYFDKE